MFPETHDWGFGQRYTASGFNQMAQNLKSSKERRGMKKITIESDGQKETILVVDVRDLKDGKKEVTDSTGEKHLIPLKEWDRKPQRN